MAERKWGAIPYVYLSLLLFLLLLSACGVPTSEPSPTSTGVLETPPPTLTSTPTVDPYPWYPTPWPTRTAGPSPTQTPRPTSTPTPGPVFPPQTTVMDGWLPLPADLFFLREGRLWRWPAEGGRLDKVGPPAGSDEDVLAYRLTPNGGYAAYVTTAGQLYVWDGSTGESILVRTAGELATDFFVWDDDSVRAPDGSYYITMDLFALTPDGRYLVYLAWGEEPSLVLPGDTWPPLTGELNGGTLFAVDLQAPDRQFELAFCGAYQGMTGWRGCRGFLLSPDSSWLAFRDGRGVWLAQVPQGEPQLIYELEPWELPEENYSCAVWSLNQWSPDNRWLLVGIGCFESGHLAVLDLGTGQVYDLPDTGCFKSCANVRDWDMAGIWAGRVSPRWDGGEFVLYQVQLGPTGELQLTYWVSGTNTLELSPSNLHPLPDGRIAFTHERCVGDPGTDSGLFAVAADDQPSLLVPLPLFFCSPHHSCRGHVVWSVDGRLFLYIDCQHNPTLLGLTDGSALWDIRELLEGANEFRWAGEGKTR